MDLNYKIPKLKKMPEIISGDNAYQKPQQQQQQKHEHQESYEETSQQSPHQPQKRQRRERLSGAQNRRIMRLIKSGYSYEKAKEMVKERLLRINGKIAASYNYRETPEEKPNNVHVNVQKTDITKPFYEIANMQNYDINDDKDFDTQYPTESKRRIEQLVKKGMKHADAVELEDDRRNVYRAYLACQRAENEELEMLQSLGDTKQEIDDYLSAEQRRHINSFVRNGIHPDVAEKILKQHLTKIKREFPAIWQQNSNAAQQQTHQHTNSELELSIVHVKHPLERLSDDQIELLKYNLIQKIRRTGDVCLDLIEFVHKDGWLAVTCANQKTKFWLHSNDNLLQLLPNVTLKLYDSHELPLIYVAKILLYPACALPPDVILILLQGQNEGLKTENWQLIDVKHVDNGNVINYFAISQECAKYLRSGREKLEILGRKFNVDIKKYTTPNISKSVFHQSIMNMSDICKVTLERY